MTGILENAEISSLLTLVEEAARSTEKGVKHFVEPAPDTLARAISKRHHIVFGRRGSGKSSLLRKAAADLTVDRRPIAYVNLEAFKGHSYPDVLLSVLISTLTEFRKWLDTAAIHPATRTSFWTKLFGTAPKRPALNRRDVAALSGDISADIDALTGELHSADGGDVRVLSGSESAESRQAGLGGGIEASGSSLRASAESRRSRKTTQEMEATFKRSKIDFLHRHVLDYQRTFRRLAEISTGDAYLFLDDLYHIRRSDQAHVLDYFHRVAKDSGLWLKVGTIRHRTNWYVHGDPPIGMKLGDDADEIDLDLTLEKYALAKKFLERILDAFARAANAPIQSSFLTSGAVDRLVLASGGVARDFLSIFRRSVHVARERAGGHRGEKVGVEDVNMAAGEYDSSKREEFKRDTLDDNAPLEEEFRKLGAFCLERNNTNCFLLDKDWHGKEADLIHELVDLKLVHLIRSRVTVSGRTGKIFEAYMLDLSQYAGARKRRDLELIEFWNPESQEDLRRVSLIYTPPSPNDLQRQAIVEQGTPPNAGSVGAPPASVS